MVFLNGLYYLYFTGCFYDDHIYLTLSKDLKRWSNPIKIKNLSDNNWDDFVIARPSIVYEGLKFHLWYDITMKDGFRHVEYASSKDGVNFYRLDKVLQENTGAVHVSRFDNRYIMLSEEHDGTFVSISSDHIHFDKKRKLIALGNNFDKYGHITPFLFNDYKNKSFEIYLGLARAASWSNNIIGKAKFNF
jgi:hypothetical protein